LVTASKVGAVVNIDNVPIHPLLKANFYDRSLELALCGGEDYELLFTGSEAKIREIEQCTTTPINVIGYITTDNVGKVMLHTSEGIPFKLRKSGWEHFATP
jgi:thiamine-monophosphate kinase